MFLLYLCLFFSFVEESTALKGVYKSPHAKKLAAFLIYYIGNSFLCNKKMSSKIWQVCADCLPEESGN